MKKPAVVLTVVVIIALGLFLWGDSSGTDDSASEQVSSEPGPEPPRRETVYTEPSTGDGTSLTRNEFDQLSREEQDKMLEEFVLDFWAKERGLTEPNAEEKNLSLEIFNRPYMYTLTEREFFQLSKEDQEKAIAEVMENCRQVRSYVMSVIAEADSCIADEDYGNAEAYYVHSLQTGRELSADREGLIITRLVGIACEKAGLNGLVKLYEKTGENSNLQIAREQLLEIDKEVEEIKRTAKEAEAKR